MTEWNDCISLSIQVANLNKFERMCSVTLDEMAIERRIEYDSSSGKICGKVDLPEHSGEATHALVFMCSGITTRWKQTVAYYFTGMMCLLNPTAQTRLNVDVL